MLGPICVRDSPVVRIRIDFGRLDTDPDPGLQNDPQKSEGIYEIKSRMFSFKWWRFIVA